VLCFTSLRLVLSQVEGSYSPTLYFSLCFTSFRPVLSQVEGSYGPAL
jgi:hypothetical protein